MWTWIALLAIVTVLGTVLWWGNRRAAQVEKDTADLAGYKPLRFTRIIPRMPRK